MTTLEFAGLPGSGKSYWSRYAASQSQAADRDVRLPRAILTRPLPARSLAKLLAVTTAVSRRPAASIDAMRLVSTSQRSRMQGLRRSMQWLDTQARLDSHANNGLIIMDEGPLQALWSIGIEGEWEPVLARVEKQGYRRADQALVLDISPESALSRLEARADGHRRLDELDSREEKLALLERGAGLLDEIVSEWTDRYGSEAVVRLDAERPDLVAQQIHDLVTRPLEA